MKSLSLALLIAVAAVSGCVHLPLGCEAQETRKKKEQCMMEVTALTLLLSPRHPPGSSPSSPQSAAGQTVNFTEETAFSNDTFLLAQVLPLPSSSTVQAVSGRIAAEGDVDIYSLSYTSGTAIAFVLDISKPGTSAVCSLYTSFGPSYSASSLPDGSMVSAGVVSANVTALALDRISHTHLYIRCSGLPGELYTVRTAYSALN